MGNISLATTIKRCREREGYSFLLLGTSLHVKRKRYGSVRVAARSQDVGRVDGNLEGILLDLENMREKNIVSRERVF